MFQCTITITDTITRCTKLATKMMERRTMLTLAFILCVFTLQVVECVPSTLQSSCSAELIQVEHGGTLNLQCGSHCSDDGSYTWWRVNDGNGEKIQLSYTRAVVTENEVTGENGGEYGCKCGSNGQICTFYVTVAPKIMFTSSSTATHYRDSVTFKCITDGYPANSSTITNAYGIALQSQIKKKINQFRIETIALVSDIEEEDYVCRVETHYRGYPAVERKQNLKINVYEPPVIMYTTEYILHKESEFGQSGKLTCAVQTSYDTGSHVTWWTGGEQLKEGAKYRMKSSTMSETVTVFELHMANVQQSDIGPYLCQLSSDYNVEETQDAWIKVDYRDDYVGGVTADNKAMMGGSPKFTLGIASSSSLQTVALLLCLVLVAGVGTWGIMVRRRGHKKTCRSDGIIGRQDSQCSSLNSPAIPHSGTMMTAFKRK